LPEFALVLNRFMRAAASRAAPFRPTLRIGKLRHP
jgi:hypothetical protein